MVIHVGAGTFGVALYGITRNTIKTKASEGKSTLGGAGRKVFNVFRSV